MRGRLTGWGWATAGALTVILIVLTVNAVITTLKQRSDEKRITHIEKVVISLRPHHRVRKGVRPHQPSSTAHQQPSPQHGGSTGNGEHVSAPSPAQETPHNSPKAPTSPPTPASGSSSPLQPVSESANTAPAPAPAPSPIPTPQPVTSVAETAQGTVEGATETACSATAGLGVCP